MNFVNIKDIHTKYSESYTLTFIWVDMFYAVLSAEVEIAGYALLTLAVHGDVASALPVVKWLSKQRNALGGFHSTQVITPYYFKKISYLLTSVHQ